VKTYPGFKRRAFWHLLLLRMLLRSTNRQKDGKQRRYFSVVENRRVAGGKTAQRTVLYLGEINDQKQAAWRKTLEVFVEDEQLYTSLSLFPEDREIPADALYSVQKRLSELELRRPRAFGHCWLACELWSQLGLDEFWRQRLPEARKSVSWEKILRLLVVNRLLDPGSEFRVHRQWYVDTSSTRAPRRCACVLGAFLAYCLQVTLKNGIMIYASGLTPRAATSKSRHDSDGGSLGTIVDGRWLMLPRHTQPEKMFR
jgi:hypothetical protein